MPLVKSDFSQKLLQAIKLIDLDSTNSLDMNSLEDIEKNIFYVSKSCKTITGYTKSEFLKKKISFENIIYHEDQSKWTEIHKRLKNNDSNSIQLRINHKNGKPIWIELKISKLYEDAIFKGFRTNIRNINKEKLNSIALLKSEERYSRLSNLTNEGILIHQNGIVLDVNKAFERISGYTFNEIKGKNIIELCVQPKFYPHVIKSLENSIFSPIKIEGITKDGTIKWLEIESRKLDHEDLENLRVSAIRDVTEHELANKKIDFLSKITQQASTPLITTDLDFKITWINNAFKNLSGYDDDIIGETPDFLNAEPNYAEIQTELYKTLSNGNTYKNILLNRRKNGSTFMCELEIFPILDNNKEIIAYGGYTRDVTQLLKVKEDVKIFKTVSDEALYGNAIVGLEGEIIYVNKYFSNIHGYQIDELIGENVSIIYNKNQIEMLTQYNKTLLRDGKLGPIEISHLRKDGIEFPMLMSCVLIFDHNNIPIYKSITAIDISILKKTEAALKKSEEFYKTIFNRAPIGIFHFDTNGIVTECNLEHSQIMQIPREKLIGKNLFTGLEDNRLINEIKKTLKNGTGYYEDYYHSVITKKVIYAIIYMNAIYDENNKIVGGVALVEDASKRKEIEKKYNENLQHLELLSVSIPNIIWETEFDENGNFINSFISEVADELLDLPKGTINNSFEYFLSFILHEYSSKVYDLFKLAISNPGNYYSLDYKVKKGNGKIAWFSSKGHVLLKEDKKIAYGSTIDITESKEATEYKEKLLKETRKLVELKSSFISMVSHEFRTPLSLILSSTELLEMFDSKWSKEKRASYFANIKNNVALLTTMLEEASFLENGKKSYFRIETFDIVDLCKEIIVQSQKSIKKRVAIDFFYDKKHFEIKSNVQLIRRILSNLLTNSLKYTPNNKKIVIRINDTVDTISFHISDEGIGIDSKIINSIFDKFVRGDNVGTISGTGLGLAIVKQAVELLNGTITVKSKINVGTSFIVNIPLNFKEIDYNN